MRLIVFLLTTAFVVIYTPFVRSIVESGSWGIYAGLIVGTFALGYLVGDEEDRADYHRIIARVLAALRLK